MNNNNFMSLKNMTDNAKRQISDDDFVYTFHPKEFDIFCKLLCREQRKVCSDEYLKSNYVLKRNVCEQIEIARIPNYK